MTSHVPPVDAAPPPPETLDWVRAVVGAGSRIVAVRAVTGGGWHANHAVEVLDAGGTTHRLVLRRWARRDWEEADPDMTARRELATLRLLERSDVPAPRLVAADPDARMCDVPALLITRLPGRPLGDPRDLDAFLRQLAEVLSRIHEVDGEAADVVPAYRRWNDLSRARPPGNAVRAGVWERALRVVDDPGRPGVRCFIHRDYHPGNTLWSRGRLTGVVDWTAASWGSPSVDLGHMRWNLAARFGPAPAHRFLAAYRAVAGRDVHDGYWDVVTLVDLLPDVDPADPLPAEVVERLEEYLARVLSEL